VLLVQNHVHANKQICMRIGFGSGGGSTYISPSREREHKMCTYLSEQMVLPGGSAADISGEQTA
jgi:hypothetical protein